jgi:wobble nucleotide-excising tRNase
MKQLWKKRQNENISQRNIHDSRSYIQERKVKSDFQNIVPSNEKQDSVVRIVKTRCGIRGSILPRKGYFSSPKRPE